MFYIYFIYIMDNNINEIFATNYFMLLDIIEKQKDIIFNKNMTISEIVNNQVFVNESSKKNICIK